ncbi:putative UDP-Gal or UDP-GlcNAc-dependent glycosyltransferase [Trypanosoma cruzi]|uniref:Hexosyltransferase n=2 Tax=Trypanosoma cruzi TaxID=5693 RepID=Q4CPT8_TRYCC|nr:UDP-Gal or UDP-GlcNAc-dependent glycosyltransferase, putative [Trypanosoma cruzi]EAN82290.1 UDP-Gal or UDP-GlcNAc-dependent glycosyltransferase, putative [Trypanosoma cruzi]PWU94184.1 putative UDP-Gal or UDP-GlcNAc-dependent glycosyltransferase [Trypanosoma cruzi]RNC56234.1 putative UDP-Gal or UDP-GlcNAc-dependent glycosyltransferase [Trypanosoma cruzi]|eukprot:XP_804141.1 UDP-Gal or UDP-GlcNAc-dependent glycosyltransferase [Trypanosoma cruzi strain CL Brener]
MAKPKLPTMNRKLKRVAMLLILFIAVTNLLSLSFDIAADDGAPEPNNPRHPRAAAVDDAALAYIPRSVVDTWSRREYLIVLGIPSTDVEERRTQRNLQRTTCWRFPGVATRANDFTGAMLVLYVLGRHPSHGYEYSAALPEEASQWNDVVALPMNEGRVTTNKTIGSYGRLGDEADVGVTRKTYMWFDLALRLFPTARYIAKGDEDIFLRVPLFVAHLRLLPRRGIYMGVHIGTSNFADKGLPGSTFMVGWCYTLSRDVAEALVSYEPLRRLAYLPYSKERDHEFALLRFHYEDNMVGWVLEKEVKYKPMVYVKVLGCHFHDARNGTGHWQVVSTSMCVHHVLRDDYAALMARFGNDTSPVARVERASDDTIYPLCD